MQACQNNDVYSYFVSKTREPSVQNNQQTITWTGQFKKETNKRGQFQPR